MSEMDSREHWERVYRQKTEYAVSWYRPHLETSLAWIEELAGGRDAAIIDIGGGASTLVDDLLARGYTQLSVLDVAQGALEKARKRLGAAAEQVAWIEGDIRRTELAESSCDVWHDRAAFHFLTDSNDRLTYIRQVRRAVKPGGVVILSTFGTAGPQKCSGLHVARYGPAELVREFGSEFRLLNSLTEMHRTPLGTEQQFLYCSFRIERDRQRPSDQ